MVGRLCRPRRPGHDRGHPRAGRRGLCPGGRPAQPPVGRSGVVLRRDGDGRRDRLDGVAADGRRRSRPPARRAHPGADPVHRRLHDRPGRPAPRGGPGRAAPVRRPAPVDRPGHPAGRLRVPGAPDRRPAAGRCRARPDRCGARAARRHQRARAGPDPTVAQRRERPQRRHRHPVRPPGHCDHRQRGRWPGRLAGRSRTRGARRDADRGGPRRRRRPAARPGGALRVGVEVVAPAGGPGTGPRRPTSRRSPWAATASSRRSSADSRSAPPVVTPRKAPNCSPMSPARRCRSSSGSSPGARS